MLCRPQRQRAAQEREYTSWDRARLSVVVPIGVIVAVAIVCIVVAVLSSAQRADDVAAVHERQLLTGALRNYGERVLREVESVATSEAAVRNIRGNFDPEWAKQNVGDWLVTNFAHDYVFIFDGDNTPLYLQNARDATEGSWFASMQADLTGVLDYMRERDPVLLDAVGLNQAGTTESGSHPQAVVIRKLLGRPVFVVAAAVGPANSIQASRDNAAPILMSVKAIDSEVLASIASQLRLANLRNTDHDRGAARRLYL